MINCNIIVLILSLLLYVGDEDQQERLYLARVNRHGDEIVRFFGQKSKSEIEKLTLSEHPQISIFAAWIHCQRKCLETNDQNLRLQHRHEFLGFLVGRLKVQPPIWWKEEILRYEATDTHSIVKVEVPIKFPDGFHLKNDIVCANDLVPAEITPYSIEFLEAGKMVAFDFVDNWEYGDCFVQEGDLPCALTTLQLKERSRIIGVVNALNVVNLICFAENGSKLWRTQLDYRVDDRGKGSTGMAPSYYLVDTVTTQDEVFVFWVCPEAISFSLLDVHTGTEKLRFSTKVHFRD